MQLLRRVAIATAAALAVTIGVSAPADAKPLPTVTIYKVINIYQNPGDWVDYEVRVGVCYAGAGGTCSIARASAVATSVSVDLGATKSDIAGKIGFSLSRTNSTTVTCSSARLTATQRYSAYRVGTRKSYRIQKWQGSTPQHHPPRLHVGLPGGVPALLLPGAQLPGGVTGPPATGVRGMIGVTIAA